MSYYTVSIRGTFKIILKLNNLIMPIKSYLAYPLEGEKEALIKELRSVENVEITPGQNEDVVIVVTDTEDNKEEDVLKEKLEALNSLKLLAMVSGFNTPK